MAEVWEGSESDPSHLAEIEAEQRRLCGLRCEVHVEWGAPGSGGQVSGAPIGRVVPQAFRPLGFICGFIEGGGGLSRVHADGLPLGGTPWDTVSSPASKVHSCRVPFDRRRV